MVSQAGKLIVLGTPIGNLGDLSPRAAKALEEAQAIYCEDTRVTKKLLNHLGISKLLVRADEHTLERKVDAILASVQAGDVVLYASDAGMPAVSDPGQSLIAEAHKQGLAIEIISGPCAAITALVASGFPAQEWTFAGFLPRKHGEQKAQIERLLAAGTPFILYESPHRVQGTLATITALDAAREVCFARELTKLHEEVLVGPIQELVQTLEHREIKGECVLVVSGSEGKQDKASGVGQGQAQRLQRLCKELKAAGISGAKCAKIMSVVEGVNRKVAYQIAVGEE